MNDLIFDEARWSIDQYGTWLKLKVRDVKEAQKTCSFVTDGKQYTASIKLYKKKRSLDANAYAWVLMDKLAEKTGISKEKIYRAVIKDIGGNNAVVCVKNEAVERLREGWERNGLGWVTDIFDSKLEGCKNVILYYGSSTYDSSQMARLIDLIVQECEIQNIETRPSEEINAMIQEYEKHNIRK